MGMLLVLMIVIGPLDYLMVNRVLNRPRMTWISYPLLVTGTALLASALAMKWNGTSRHANQLSIVNVDVATATASARHFVTIYSPSTTQTDIAVKPQPLSDTATGEPVVRLSWQGVPESAFGGMLRPLGIEQGGRYWQQADGMLTDIPVMQWSSKALVADSTQSVPGLVECDLKASATGRLTGTITHRFASPIEDWLVVYKNVVYRYLKQKDDAVSLPFPSRTAWRVEQPRVHSRELRPFLTGVFTMATPRFGAKATAVDGSHQQSSYDPLSLDPASLVRVMTFHDEVGGDRYTGLSNLMLDGEDCSHLLKLGRAILFGRLQQSVSVIQQDQSTIEPDRQVSFVRLILPVTRSSEVIKDLRRVVPE